MLFSSKIHILKRDSCTIILYNRQYSKKLQLLCRSGYPEAQEVKIDLLFFYSTSQNLTNSNDELYLLREDTGCNSPTLQIEFFSKDATRDLLFCGSL